MKKLLTLLILAAMSSGTGCDRPACANENLIFDKYSPNDPEYRSELARQLRLVDQSNLRYWSYDLKTEDGRKHLYANIQSNELCAIMVLTVENSEKGIEDLIDKNNMSYRGAELKGLRYETREANGKVRFVFREVSGIED